LGANSTTHPNSFKQEARNDIAVNTSPKKIEQNVTKEATPEEPPEQAQAAPDGSTEGREQAKT
jgi:hypothetical protein